MPSFSSPEGTGEWNDRDDIGGVGGISLLGHSESKKRDDEDDDGGCCACRAVKSLKLLLLGPDRGRRDA